MPIFEYQARDQQGQLRQGQIEAANVPAAIQLLSGQLLEVIGIRLSDEASAASDDREMEAQSPVAIKLADDYVTAGPRAEYLTRLDEILSKRDGLLELLEAIAAEKSVMVGDQLEYLIKRIKGGITAEELLADRNLLVWLPVITAGHNPELLQRQYARWTAQVSSQQQRVTAWWWALSYPLFLIVCAVLLLVPLYIFVVPSFKKMFYEFGLLLPAPTMLMISISDLILGRPLELFIGAIVVVVLLVLAIRYWNSHPITTKMFGVFTSGSNPHLIAMSRMLSVLAEMLELGAPLSDSLVIAGSASRFAFYKDLCCRLASEVQVNALHWQQSAVRHSLPPTFMYALMAGPGQSPSIPLVRELAEAYSERTQYRLKMQAGVATPLMVCLVGISIGFVVVALFMPLVQMVTSLT